MGYTNSPLVNYTLISPNRNAPRNHAIDTITIHMVWGQCSVEALGDIFYPTSRQASSNYGVGVDGRIGMYCPESDRSWCSSSPANDHRAITIETASDTFYPYAVKDVVYNSLIKLCADICKRNGKTKMVWCGSLAATNARTFASNEMRMTLHKWFAATECPGQYLESRMGDIAEKVNKILGGADDVLPAVPFTAKVLIGDLNIRSGASTTSTVVGIATKNKTYTVVEVKNNFGRIDTKKWIFLGNSDYVKIGNTIIEPVKGGYGVMKKCGLINIKSDYAKESLIGTFTLPKGVHMVTVMADWGKSAKGTRYFHLSTEGKYSSKNYIGWEYIISDAAAADGRTRQFMTVPITCTKETTYYIWGAQNSGETIEVRTAFGYVTAK